MWPQSIRGINALPDEEKQAIYRTLLPDWLFVEYGIDPETLTREGRAVAQFRCPTGSRSLEISVKHHPADIDAMLYLHMADTFNQQLMVLLTVVNDPNAPRFNTDRDSHGNPTH